MFRLFTDIRKITEMQRGDCIFYKKSDAQRCYL
jgi:hypothetical protein